MKKLVLATILVFAAMTTSAQADGRHHRNHGHHHHHRGHNHNWVGPAIGGAIIGGIILDQYYRRPPPVYHAPPPAYYPPPAVYVDPYAYPYPTQCRQYRRVDAWGNWIIVEECF